MVKFSIYLNRRVFVMMFMIGGDAMGRHNGYPFSTSNQDKSAKNCSAKYENCWWYTELTNYDCVSANLNGNHNQNGTLWYDWKTNKWHSLKKTEIKVRRV